MQGQGVFLYANLYFSRGQRDTTILSHSFHHPIVMLNFLLYKKTIINLPHVVVSKDPTKNMYSSLTLLVVCKDIVMPFRMELRWYLWVLTIMNILILLIMPNVEMIQVRYSDWTKFCTVLIYTSVWSKFLLMLWFVCICSHSWLRYSRFRLLFIYLQDNCIPFCLWESNIVFRTLNPEKILLGVVYCAENRRKI